MTVQIANGQMQFKIMNNESFWMIVKMFDIFRSGTGNNDHWQERSGDEGGPRLGTVWL